MRWSTEIVLLVDGDDEAPQKRQRSLVPTDYITVQANPTQRAPRIWQKAAWSTRRDCGSTDDRLRWWRFIGSQLRLALDNKTVR
jgi:hypothetical protein